MEGRASFMSGTALPRTTVVADAAPLPPKGSAVTDAPPARGAGEQIEKPAAPVASRPSPLTALRLSWRLTTALVLVGLAFGIGMGASRQATYTAEARAAVGTGSLSAQAVAGYSIGIDAIAADYARAVTTQDEKRQLAQALGPGPDGVDGLLAANASPLPDSAVVRVDVDATSAALAVKAADAVSSSFVSGINTAVQSSSPKTLLAKYNAIEAELVPAQVQQSADQARVTSLQGAGASTRAITAAQTALQAVTLMVNDLSAQASAANAAYQAAVAQPTTENGLRPVQSAYLVGSNRRSLIERWVLIGLALGAVAALAAVYGRDIARGRRVDVGVTDDPAPAGASVRLLRDVPPAEPVSTPPVAPPEAPVQAPAESPVEAPVPAPVAVEQPVEAPVITAPPSDPPPADPYLREAIRVALSQRVFVAGVDGASPGRDADPMPEPPAQDPPAQDPPAEVTPRQAPGGGHFFVAEDAAELPAIATDGGRHPAVPWPAGEGESEPAFPHQTGQDAPAR